MDVTVSVSAADGDDGDDGGDSLRSLHAWLVAEDELRGRVRLVTPPPRPGTLGSVVEMLAVSVAPGGALTVLAGALIMWIRRQKSTINVKVNRPDGTCVELSLDARLRRDEFTGLTNDLARFLNEAGGPDRDRS